MTASLPAGWTVFGPIVRYHTQPGYTSWRFLSRHEGGRLPLTVGRFGWRIDLHRRQYLADQLGDRWVFNVGFTWDRKPQR